MKRFRLSLLIYFTLPFVVFAQSYNTISIDGINNGWTTDETFTNCSTADNAYLTWDEDYLYIGISDAEADYGNLATFIIIDSDPAGSNGTTGAYAWTDFVTVPFPADYVVVWKNSDNYIEVRDYNEGTSTWDQDSQVVGASLNTDEVNFAIGTDYREVRIKRSIIGNPNAIKITMFTEQQWGSNWRYFTWPSNGWTDQNRGSGQSIPNNYGFLTINNIKPIDSHYYNAEIKLFDGSGSDWATADNWTGDELPTSASLCVIPSSKAAVEIGATNTADCYDLAILGSLTIKSTASGTGSLKTTGTVSGNATVERYLTNYSLQTDDKYHFISSPVASQAIRPDFVANTPLAAVDFFKFSELTYEWINSKIETEEDVFEWNSDFESDFVVGRGYMVAYLTIPETPKTFSGNLNSYPTGSPLVLTCTNTIDKGNGWNLLGNPFPSAIDWTLVSLGDGMDNALYYYDAASENYRYYIQLAGETGSLDLGSRYIPAMQGFMVHAKTTGTKTVTIDNDDRTHNGQSVYYKSTNTLPGSLSIKVVSGSFEDEMFVHFNSGATTQFDGNYDAFKLSSYNTQVPQLYTQSSDEKKLAINGLPELSEQLEIPVYFKAGISGQQSIIADLSNVEATAYLTDIKTGAIQNLRENPVYSFSANPDDELLRFKLKFSTVGINDTPTTQTVVAYYNAGSLYISAVEGTTNIGIYNIQGQNLTNHELHGSGLQNLSLNLPSGVYFARIVNDGKMQTVKIIVQ